MGVVPFTMKTTLHKQETAKLQTHQQACFKADGKELEFLHGVIRCDSENGFVELETEQSHALIVIKKLSIDAKSCKGINTPMVHLSLEEAEAAERSPLLA
eukprot:2404346-Amphidinium_carterae.1